MNEYLLTMEALIGDLGFRMMGTIYKVYDNDQHTLQWEMGKGARCHRVIWQYDLSKDLYRLTFVTFGPSQYGIWQIIEEKKLDMVYVEDVLDLIEKHTGFYLTLYPRDQRI